MSCQGCSKRHIGCHAECGDYQAFVDDRKKALAKQHKEAAAYNMLTRGFITREKKARHLGFKTARRNRGT